MVDNVNSFYLADVQNNVFANKLSEAPPCTQVCSKSWLSKEPINLSLFFIGPVSSVPGSPSVIFLQPLLIGKSIAAAGIVIGAQLFLYLAEKIFGLELLPAEKVSALSELQISMPVGDLQEFLTYLSRGSLQTAPATLNNTLAVTGDNDLVTLNTPDIPLVVGLLIISEFTEKSFAPSVLFALPLFSLPGVQGSLPILILITLSTILVRMVVPPHLTGAKPIPNVSAGGSSKLQLSTEELLNILNKFGKHFCK